MQPTIGTQPGHGSSSQARVKKEKPWEVGEDHQSCLSGHGHGENLRSFILFTEKAMAPHSSPLAWKIPWTEESGGLQPWGRQDSDMTERLHFHFSLSCIGEGNGNPLQCSCLENPRDGGA